MYFDYFGLKKNPFRITPDEDFLYLLDSHKNSFAYLKYTAWANDGFMLLSGEIGTGKTILLRKLCKDLGSSIKIISISQTQLELDDLLRFLLYELTESFEGASRAEFIIRIRENLLERKKQGEKILLVLDEAQNLNRECLEEIRLLADEMYDGENLINIILAGQPEIENNIDLFGLEQLRQRIRITYRLTELRQRDVGPYMDFRTYIGYGNEPYVSSSRALISGSIHQIKLANFKRLFVKDSSAYIYKLTRGVPRLINALCETSLVLAFGENKKIINNDLIAQAVDELGWLAFEDDEEDNVAEATGTHDALFFIEVSQDGKLIKTVGVSHLPFAIGRSDINDLVLINKTVSKQHAILDFQNDKLIIKDHNSTNGVKINGLKVVAHVISNGEVAQIGRYKLRFILGVGDEGPVDSDTVTTMQILKKAMAIE
jgi:type II secretory pathway predicted ATPase ExeA